ncbi:MAG: DUF3134 family protein [Thainema sp.]
MYNPSLHEYRRNQVAPVLPPSTSPSVLEWLESSGRLIERDTKETETKEEDEEEITALMGSENYDDEDDDLDDVDDED